MDEKLRQLLDRMPERAPRSKLEPHAEVIRELRKKRRTYQEMAAFFREHLQLSVAPSTLHAFIKTRARQARQKKEDEPELLPASAPLSSVLAESQPMAAPAFSSPADEGRERLRALRTQPLPAKSEPPRFTFDPQAPLTLHPPKKEK